MSENTDSLNFKIQSLPDDPATKGIRRRLNYLRHEFGYNDDYFLDNIVIDKTDFLLMKTGYYPQKESATKLMLNYLEIYESSYLAFLKKNDAMDKFIDIF